MVTHTTATSDTDSTKPEKPKPAEIELIAAKQVGDKQTETQLTNTASVPRIVIVGGGAGGLELATSLGRKLGKKGKAHITLVDKNRTHLWKPLLHEVATGALDVSADEVNYNAHGKKHGFSFQYGCMNGLDKTKKHISLDAIHDDAGVNIVPERYIHYDILVFALGSVTNDFGTQGVADNCYFLDSTQQAERFHTRLLNECLRSQYHDKASIDIAIVGAGATGVELSAELYNAIDILESYGISHISKNQLNVALVEAGDSILPALPERVSAAVAGSLSQLGVSIHTQTRVTSAQPNCLNAKTPTEDIRIHADLMVWAAGVKAPNFMQHTGLETNRANQLVVNASMQTSDPAIFAIGDCASVLHTNGRPVPPRAQAAHQQATHMSKTIRAVLAGKKQLPTFVYYDKGSLVSLSSYSTVGSLMGNLTKGPMMIEGRLARLVYVSLYRLHQIALHGYWRTFFMNMAGHINKVIKPKLKLH